MIIQDEPELLIERAPHLEPTMSQDYSRSINGRVHGTLPREKKTTADQGTAHDGGNRFDLGGQFSHTPSDCSV